MAYCDYLFRRTNGIFYFRYVLIVDDQKRREIRISLKTRSYSIAKQLSASCYVKLQYQLVDKDNLRMNADDLLKSIKPQLLQAVQAVDPENKDYLSRFEKAFSEITTMVEWVKKHLTNEFEGQSLNDVRELYYKYAPLFKQVKKESDEHKRAKLEEDIRAKACAFYGIVPQVSVSVSDSEDNSSDLKIGQVAEMYCEEMIAGKNWTDKTLFENKATYQLFKELQGDLYLSDIDIKVIIDLKAQLLKVPVNFRKKPQLKGQMIKDIVEKDHQLTPISVSSVNKHLTKLSTLLGWAKKYDYCKGNVASGVTIKQRKNEQDDKLPYIPSELSQIFSSQFYSPNKNYKHTYYFWLPLLGLFTGARISELCQLTITDIGFSDQVHYIYFNEEDDKKLKNEASKRKTPIHSKLIDIGFLKYVDEVKKLGHERVFPTINGGGRDGYGQDPSKWFGRKKDKLVLVEPDKKTFHSLRHNMSDALKAADVHEEISARIIGHKHPNITYGRYGSDPKLIQLRENIEKIDYSFLEFDCIEYTNIAGICPGFRTKNEG